MNLVDQMRHTNDVTSRLTDMLNSLSMDHTNGKITESQFLMKKAKVCHEAEKITGMKIILNKKLEVVCMITQETFNKAMQCLMDNTTIEGDEAKNTIQALCYILCDVETEQFMGKDDNTTNIRVANIHNMEIMRLTGRIIKRKPNESIEPIGKYPLYSSDIFNDTDCTELFEITSVYVDPSIRRRGIGTMLIKQAIRQAPDMPIICAPTALKCEYKEKPTDEEMFEILKTLGEFFNQAGFESVNDAMKYENHEAMVYADLKGRELIEKLTGRTLSEEWLKARGITV